MLSERELSFVLSQTIGRLGTAGARGRPHVVPVCFAYLDGCFWIAVDEKPKRTQRLKRLRNIEENPQVALIFDRYTEDWSRLAWVMVRGRADLVDSGPERERAIEALRERYEQYRSMALAGPVIKVTVEKVTSWGAV